MRHRRFQPVSSLMRTNNSSLELNAAIIVSSAPGFASFARSHLLENSTLNSLLSKLMSFSLKTRGSKSMLASGSKSDKITLDDDEHAKQPHSHHYYELNEACRLQSGVSADQGGKTWVPLSPGSPEEVGIVRTMAFEQTVKSSAV